MKHLVAVFVVVMMAPVVARAQSAAPSSEPVAAPAPAPAGAVSPAVAELLSLGGTAASVATIAASNGNLTAITVGTLGAIVLPSLGRWYAHAPAVGGVVARAVGAGALIGAFFVGYRDENIAGGLALLTVGSASFLGGTIYDLVQAPRDALAYNAHLKDVAIVPVIQPDHRGFGLALSARF